MINTKLLDSEYDKYRVIKDEYDVYKEELESIKIADYDGIEDVLRTYRSAKKEKSKVSKDVLSVFLEKYPIIARIEYLENLIKNYEGKINDHFSMTETFDFYEKYITLKHLTDDGYDLINIYTQDTLNLDQYDEDKQNYILDDLRKKNSFIGSITRDELPLLMNILEDMDIEIDYSDMDSDDVDAEKYYVESSRCYEMFIEIQRTRLYDNNELTYHRDLVNMLLDFDCEFEKLNQSKKSLTEKEYWDSFYRLKILSGENIEKMYLDADNDHKEYIINTYYKLSTPSEHNTKEDSILHLRTASSIINQEVLKRKVLKNNN